MAEPSSHRRCELKNRNDSHLFTVEPEALVADIGGTFTKFAVMEEDGEILNRGKVPTEKESEEAFLGMLEGLYRAHGHDTEGMAISAAGVIDSERGYLYNAGSIPGIHNLDLAQKLEGRLGVPVTVEQDGHCAAIAELWKGSLTGCRYFNDSNLIGALYVLLQKVCQ